MSEDGSPLNNELSIQIANLLKNSLNTQNTNHKLSDILTIKDEKYEQWEQEDLVVFSWLIQNIEPSLASNLTEFPTVKTLWDALVVTYSSGKDKLQTFELHVKANEFKQNGIPLEDFWIVMQGIWGEIERRDPSPMTCAVDITTYNNIRAEKKLFQFLNALDQQFDPIKREILRWDKLPTAEEAYAAVRKQTAHRNILGFIPSPSQGITAGLIASEITEGAGYAARGGNRVDPNAKMNGSSRIDKSKLKCTNCGMNKHTKDQCFKLVGYPEWWSDGHKKGKKEGGDTAASVGNLKATGNGGGNHTGGFGGIAPDQFGDANIPGRRDIRTGMIIGCGTERQGLYYVDEVTQQGTVMLAHGTVDREAWLWHIRLGHPSNTFIIPNTVVRGEKESNDTLCWLKWMPTMEEESHSTQAESSSPHSTAPTISVTGHDLPNLVPEVSNTETTQENPNYDFDSSNHDNQENHEVETEQVEPLQDEPNETSETEETTERYVLPPRVNRGIPPKRYSPEKVSRKSMYPMANVTTGNFSKEAKAFMTAFYSKKIPLTVEQDLESKNWRDAMETEIDALRKNETWKKCVLPPEKIPVGCRWVFTVKHKPDGTIERYKARLVAKGYTQTYGVDYSETFSPVAKIDTIRVLFSIVANEDWPFHQLDDKNAFLHGKLNKEVYMEAPPGFTQDFKKGEVCHLKKSLYGLKQSPRAWFGIFTLAMKKYGFKQSNSDHTLFLKQNGKLITYLIIYVDDMIITGNDEEEVKKLKENLSTEFEMKDLGRLKYFLGIEVLRSKKGIFIRQKKYVLELLAETGMIDCKPTDTPMMANLKLQRE
ncbi:uncharacterized protein LOC143589490 [Bidens hawaiensis]|uniref:uncharacterized protein LOC143589490 n=1 Tax=Bidens hawaiensis TaxID=980011 RepID=UPI00404B8C1D